MTVKLTILYSTENFADLIYRFMNDAESNNMNLVGANANERPILRQGCWATENLMIYLNFNQR